MYLSWSLVLVMSPLYEIDNLISDLTHYKHDSMEHEQ